MRAGRASRRFSFQHQITLVSDYSTQAAARAGGACRGTDRPLPSLARYRATPPAVSPPDPARCARGSGERADPGRTASVR